MRRLRKLNFVMAVVLAAAMVLPQGALAMGILRQANGGDIRVAGNKGTGDKVRSASNTLSGQQMNKQEVIFRTNGIAGEEAKILKKYKLTVKRRDFRIGYVLAQALPGSDLAAIIRGLKNEKAVQYAQPNYKYSLLARPNDPQYSRQWAMAKINAEPGWGIAKTNSPVTVAVLDTGVDVNHPDLKGRLVQGINTVNPLKSARDDEGHGTHVAGIIGATNNNGLGVSGIAGIPGIKIMPIKTFDQNGGSDISISDGIIWAADHGAKVMNMSFGSYYQSEVLSDAIDYAYGKGVVMVAAAGNWASQEISYPAALSKVIAVSATDKKDKLADFSSYGPQIDVCAPGDEIYSTYWDPYKGSTYTELSGTSMASPMVTGLAALLLAKNPKLTNDEVRQIIEMSATDLGDPGWDPQYGHGMINVAKALNMSVSKKSDGNSSALKAVTLTSGVSFKEKISSGNDTDWYKIQVPDKSSLQVEVLPAGNVSPGVEIYDSNGEVAAAFNTSDSSKQNGMEAPAPFIQGGLPKTGIKVAQAVYGLVKDLDEGEYFIKIFGNHFRWSEEDYTITARVFSQEQLAKDTNEPNDTLEAAKSLELGGSASGALLSGEDVDVFKVNLTGGTAYKINVDVPAGLDLALDIESEANYEEPANDQDWESIDERWFAETINNAGQGEDEEGTIIIPPKGTGTYYISVYDLGGASVNANYQMNITKFDFSQDKYEKNDTFESAANISIGEEVTANFHSTDDEDWFAIDVPSLGILKLDVKQPAKMMCNFELYSDPEGEPEGASYPDSGFGPSFGGLPQLTKTDRSFEFKVAKGKYYLRVNNFGAASAENYSFKTQLSTFDFVDNEINDRPSKADEISLNSTKYGTLYPESDVDFYVLNIEKPGPILVSLTPPTDLDTGAVVFKEAETQNPVKGLAGGLIDGNKNSAEGSDVTAAKEPQLEPLSEINSGGKGKLDTGVFVVTKPGRYYLMVATYGNRLQGLEIPKSSGKYSLNVKPFKSQPDAWENNNSINNAKLLSSGEAIKPTFMGTEDPDWFKIYASGKGKLNVNLTVPSDIDGVLEIYNSDGKLMTKVDQSMVGEEEFTTIAIPNAGYYYIKTYDYLGNSSVLPYTLTARFMK